MYAPLSDFGGDTKLADAFATFEMLLPKTPLVTVKNTFIQDVDAEDTDDDDEMPPMLVTRSCPAVPRQLDEPWKLTVPGIQEAVADCGGSDSEEERDIFQPRRVTRTRSDFSEASFRYANQTEETLPEATGGGGGTFDYGFEYTPTSCVGGSPAERGSPPDFGVDVDTTVMKDDEEDDQGSVPMAATLPMPAPGMPLSMPDVSPYGLDGFGTVGYDPRLLHLMAQRMHWRSVMASAAAFSSPPQMVLPIVPEASRQASSDSDDPVSTEVSTHATNVVKPLEIREPEWSDGSRAHGAGECRPCAWFWRPQGCLNGEECRHCHMCPQSAIKARRKAKQTRK